MEQQEPASELRDYLALLWRQKWFVIVTAAVVFGAAMLYAFRQVPIYSASAEVLVTPVSLPVGQPAGVEFLNMASEQRIATSPKVEAAAAKQAARRDVEPGSISVSNPDGEETLIFTSSSTDPETAAVTAQAYADAYLDYREAEMDQILDTATTTLARIVTDLETQVTEAQRKLSNAEASGNDARASVYQLQLNSLLARLDTQQRLLSEIALDQTQTVGEVLVPASIPTVPVSPDYRRIGILGAFLGISFGIGAGFLRSRLDQSFGRRGEVEASIGAPLLAEIPPMKDEVKRLFVVEDPHSADAEAYRTLRARIAFVASQRDTETILVTSFQDGDGKTTTVANLAAALAATGKTAVLVAADVHRPRLGLFVSVLQGAPGLGDILAGQADLADCLVSTPIPELRFLPAGRPLDGASELLGSDSMAALIASLRHMADFVLFDSPPLSGASDALTLAPMVDGVVLVADAQRTTRPMVEEAGADLRSVGANLLGVVLTRVDSVARLQYRQYREYQESPVRSPAAAADGLVPARPFREVTEASAREEIGGAPTTRSAGERR